MLHEEFGVECFFTSHDILTFLWFSFVFLSDALSEEKRNEVKECYKDNFPLSKAD
jgi:hypothetical protein